MVNAMEYLDIVDPEDKVIGKLRRSEIYSKELSNFRVVSVFIRNKKGKLWIPRRAANKRLFPLCLDCSATGHVESGEDYDCALKREVLEELNIDISTISYTLIGKLTPYEHGISSFQKVYEILMDDTPDYNRSDFVESFWLTPMELINKLKSEGKSKDDLPKLIEIFYSK